MDECPEEKEQVSVIEVIKQVIARDDGKRPTPLADIYLALPDHTQASIRGTLNACIKKGEHFQRVPNKKGLYMLKGAVLPQEPSSKKEVQA